jgi:VanZ family protein
MPEITQAIIERGDLAHIALFLWASGASGLLVWALKELASANRRFDDFVRELAHFNRRFGDRP